MLKSIFVGAWGAATPKGFVAQPQVAVLGYPGRDGGQAPQRKGIVKTQRGSSLGDGLNAEGLSGVCRFGFSRVRRPNEGDRETPKNNRSGRRIYPGSSGMISTGFPRTMPP